MKTTRLLMALVLAAWVPVTVGADRAPEFDGLCAQGLAEGMRIKTTCEIHWVDEDGSRYCFTTEDARTVFLENPRVNIEKARDFLATSAVEETGDAMNSLTSDDVKAFVRAHVKAQTREDGVFRFRDVTAQQDLELVYVEFNLMRTLHGYGYFPDLVFHEKGDPDKKYWIDLWVRPRGGQLEVIDTQGLATGAVPGFPYGCLWHRLVRRHPSADQIVVHR